ncbi:MAG: AMP-binding protein [Planctomycetes bacterium]|nr:AMP-binding protein [Planctomycetota bacterium]
MGEVVDLTIGEVLRESARRFPRGEAFAFPEQDVRWTWAAFDKAVTDVARSLIALGVEPGDRVAVWANNLPEWALLEFAIARIGGVLVTINTGYQAEELLFVLRKADVRHLFLCPEVKGNDLAAALARAIPGAAGGPLPPADPPSLRTIHVLRGEAPGLPRFEDLLRRAREVPEAAVRDRERSTRPGDAVNLQFTYGSAPRPKGVLLTHRNVVNNAIRVGACMEIGPADRVLAPVPFYHCFGCVMSALVGAWYGCATITLADFQRDRVMRAIGEERATALHGVPTMFCAEMALAGFEDFDRSTLRTGIMAGAPCPPDLVRRVIEDFRIPELTIAYGLTEASPVVSQTRAGDPLSARIETVGRPHPDVEVKLVDPETGRDLPPDGEGELWVRGYLLMEGYVGDPEETARILTPDGWLRSGDRARIDADGYIRITGLVKNMLLRGGENISPAQIESFLTAHPDIEEACVVGAPDAFYGEQVAAFIRARRAMTTVDIREYALGRIARYKLPRYVEFVDRIPRGLDGEPDRRALRERAARLAGERKGP